MKILVTGGAGFIGSNIVREGVNRGHTVTVFDNLSTGVLENLDGLTYKLIRADLLDDDALIEATQGVDCVFHLAASVGNLRSINNPVADLESNYIGTLRLLEAMRDNQVKRLIYSSTAAGYGEPRYLPVDEDHPFNPDSPYGVTKIASEKLALCYGRIYDMQVTCLRYFNAYGINQRFDSYGNVIPIFAARILSGKPVMVYGDGNQTRDFINVQDIAKANWNVCEKNIEGYFNVATGRKTSINELLTTFKKVSGLNPEIVYEPARKGEVKHSVASIRKAHEKWGYQPEVNLEAGLSQYWNWFKTINR